MRKIKIFTIYMISFFCWSAWGTMESPALLQLFTRKPSRLCRCAARIFSAIAVHHDERCSGFRRMSVKINLFQFCSFWFLVRRSKRRCPLDWGQSKPMNIVYKFLVALALLLAQHVYALDPSGQSDSREVSSDLQISCPAADFPAFVRAFSNDVNVQRAFTKYPLKKQWLDPDPGPEPREVIQDLDRHQIQFPILPLPEERVNYSLEIRIDSVTADSAKITLVEPDTDYQVSYFFKKNSCWTLTRIEDWSL